MSGVKAKKAWGILWRQAGKEDSLLGDFTLLFATRSEARQYINRHFGYIRHRTDLRRPPHGWRMPHPVMVKIIADADS